MQEIEIREATPEDIDDILTLAEQWEIEGSTLGFEAGARDFYLSRLGPNFLVALTSGKLIGYAACTEKNSEYAILPDGAVLIEIEEIYVSPELRSRGIGSELLEHLKTSARERGVRYLHLFTASAELDRICAFYREHGFTPWGFQAYADLYA